MRMHGKKHTFIDSWKPRFGFFLTCSLHVAIVCVLSFACTVSSLGQDASNAPSTSAKIIPYNWIDADNGYHVIRLTNEPGSKALDSRRNAFTPDGKDMVYLSDLGLHIINLATRKDKLIVHGHIDSLAVGTKTRRVFFSRGSNIYLYVVDLDTGVITQLGNLHSELFNLPVRGEIM